MFPQGAHTLFCFVFLTGRCSVPCRASGMTDWLRSSVVRPKHPGDCGALALGAPAPGGDGERVVSGRTQCGHGLPPRGGTHPSPRQGKEVGSTQEAWDRSRKSQGPGRTGLVARWVAAPKAALSEQTTRFKQSGTKK